MITDTELRTRIRAAFPFLEQAPKGFVEDFFRAAAYARLDKGAFICLEGAQCSHLALVLAGSARVYKLGETGREITLYRVETGQSCVLTASCILNGLPFPAFAVSEAPVEAAVLPPAQVARWVAESPAWRAYVFGLVAARLGEVIGVVEEVAFRRMDRRIAAFLLQRAAEESAAPVQATHQQIAAELGTSREVVTRILKDLEEQGLIGTGRGSVRIRDAEGLRAKSRE